MTKLTEFLARVEELKRYPGADELGAIAQSLFWFQKSTDENKIWIGKTYLEVQSELAQYRTDLPKLLALVKEMSNTIELLLNDKYVSTQSLKYVDATAGEILRKCMSKCERIAGDE